MSFSSRPRTKPSSRPQALTDPIHYPQTASSPERSKRAWILIILTIFLPGSAQILAGDRKFGRRALRVTLTVWALILVLVILFLFRRDTIFTWFTHPITSMVTIFLLIALAIGWAIVFLNTLRIIRPGLLAPGMRVLTILGLVIAMVFCTGTLGYAAYQLTTGRNALGNIFTGPAIPPEDGRYNFLVLGGDAGEDREGRRPDSITVFSVDASNGKAVTVSIPRNLQNAPFPSDSPLRSKYPKGYNCGDECIIGNLYTDVNGKYKDLYPKEKDPGAKAMMEAATGILGIKVQGYVLIDMAGFTKLIDALGGVKINAGGWVPISGAATDLYGGHEPPVGWIAPGPQTLNGERALWYARSREFATDYARSQRQQCIQQAIIKQMNPSTVFTKFEEISRAGTEVVESNLSQDQIGTFVDLAIKSRSQPLDRLTLGPPDFDAQFPTYPNFQDAQQRVKNLIAGKTATASASATPQQPGAGASQGGGKAPAEAPKTQQQPGVEITEAYLQNLAIQSSQGSVAARDTLSTLLANNGECTPG